MSILEWVTLITAIWGAVTGTIALVLKFREDMEDKPNLLIQPEFQFTGFRLPLDIMYLKVNIINIGHRPTTLDTMYLFFRPRNIFSRLIWKIQKKGKVWILTSSRFEQTITEGKHTDFHLDPKDIHNPDGLDLSDLDYVVVRDKAGREWKSKKEFGQRRLKLSALVQTLESKTLKLETPKKEFEIYLCRVGKKYDLRYRYLVSNTYKYHYDRFTTLGAAQKEYKDLLIKAEKFISGEIETPEIIEA